MGLYKGRVNPLNILSLRKLNRIPPTFSKIYLKDFFNSRDLDRWIYLNLDGRYCLKDVSIIDNNRIVSVVAVGLENAAEMTMLTLACPHLHSAKIVLSK